MKPFLLFLMLCSALTAHGQGRKIQVEGLDLDRSVIVLSCAPGWRAPEGQCNDTRDVRVSAKLSGEGSANARLNKIVSGGRVMESSKDGFRWDLTGVMAGTYTVTVYAEAPDGRISDPKTSTITVKECDHCGGGGDSCPVVELIATDRLVQSGESIEVAAKASGVSNSTTFSWTVSAGTISAGQGTPKITIDTTGVPGGTSVTATLDLQIPDGFMLCQTNYSESIGIAESPTPVLIDEFSTVATTCEDGNARLDSYFVDLNNNPNDRGVLVIYDSTKRRRAAWYREQLLTNFIKVRRFDRSRIAFIRGPYRTEAMVQFWRVPLGASDPDLLTSNVPTVPAQPEAAPAKPYLYARGSLEPLPECEVPMFDLVEYGRALNTDPRSRGRIVIGDPTRAGFAHQQREIATKLAANGVPRARLAFVYKYVRPNRALETVELWIVPPARR